MENKFKKNLKEIREFLGLTQAELAKKAGFHFGEIAHYESGSRKPSMDNLVHLSEALNVTIDRLVK